MRSKQEEGSAKNRHMGKKRPSQPLLAVLVLVALFAVSCGAAGGEQAKNSQVAPEQSQAAADPGHPSLGVEDAPVVLIEYSDLQ